MRVIVCAVKQNKEKLKKKNRAIYKIIHHPNTAEMFTNLSRFDSSQTVCLLNLNTE